MLAPLSPALNTAHHRSSPPSSICCADPSSSPFIPNVFDLPLRSFIVADLLLPSSSAVVVLVVDLLLPSLICCWHHPCRRSAAVALSPLPHPPSLILLPWLT
ncbi:hypothetical protein ACLOJK_011868 [Asimina triloba]